MNEILTAVLDSPRRVLFVDATTGSIARSINLDGDLVTGPIVIGDQCTIGVRLNDSRTETRVINMKTGSIINRFVTR